MTLVRYGNDDRDGNTHELGELAISRVMTGMMDMLRVIHHFSGMVCHGAEASQKSFPKAL